MRTLPRLGGRVSARWEAHPAIAGLYHPYWSTTDKNHIGLRHSVRRSVPTNRNPGTSPWSCDISGCVFRPIHVVSSVPFPYDLCPSNFSLYSWSNHPPTPSSVGIHCFLGGELPLGEWLVWVGEWLSSAKPKVKPNVQPTLAHPTGTYAPPSGGGEYNTTAHPNSAALTVSAIAHIKAAMNLLVIARLTAASVSAMFCLFASVIVE